MRPSSAIIRAKRLSGRRWALLGEALLVLGFVCPALRLLPFRRSILLGCRPLPTERTGGPAVVTDAAWAVRAAGRIVPWKAVCIHQGIALQWMLRRRAVDAILHYGLRNAEDSALSAHVWVTVERLPVLGGENHREFQCVATYP
jgi:hypothetical protein